MRLDRIELHALSTAYPGTVSLSVRDLPPGLTAIVGPIGAGKTALLEAPMLAVYRRFPSRPDALVDFAVGRDSYVLAEYALEDGRTLRSRVLLDGERRQVKAVIEEIGADGTAVVLNTDGLTTTFDDIVEERFQSWDLTMASAFASQTKDGSFAGKRESERMALFVEMLGLASMQQQAETASAGVAIIDGGRQRLHGEIRGLEQETGPLVLDALQKRANALQAEGGQLELRRRELAAALEAQRTARAELLAEAGAHLDAQARIAEFTHAIGARQQELAYLAEQRRLEDRVAQDQRRAADDERARALAALTTGLEAVEWRLESTLREIDGLIANNRTELLGKAEAIRAAVAAKAEAEQELASVRAEEATARTALDRAREQIQDRVTRLADLQATRSALHGARERAGLLETVKFGADCAVAPVCPLVVEAAAAKADIPRLEAALLQDKSLREGVEYWAEQRDAAQFTLDQLAARQRAVTQRLASAEPLAGRAPRLAEAEGRIAELDARRAAAVALRDADVEHIEAQRAGVDATHATAIDAIADRLQARIAELDTRRADAEAGFSAAKTALALAQQDADHTVAAAQRLDVADQAIESTRTEIATVDASLAAFTERRAGLERDQQTYAAKVDARRDRESRLAQLDAMRRAWQTNADALGRDGLQRLEVDAAGPAVTMTCNDLLLAAGMPRFTVELVTQVDRAGGKGQKDKCELITYDNAHGGVVRPRLSCLSPGQRALVEQAFRFGVAAYNNLKSATPWRTAWCDEVDGALDEETAPLYVPMLRRFAAIAGIEKVLFVTHNMEVAALADAQIRVAQGRIEIVQQSESELRAWLASVSERRAA